MDFLPLKLPGSFEVRLKPRGDARGYFMRTYDDTIFAERGLSRPWVQENQSRSVQKGVLRGLHFQKAPYCETKLVRCISGAILDVFVDLRLGSQTYGQWDSIVLSSEAQNAVYIPSGFAHGFLTLTDDTIVAYKVDAPYAPQAEVGLRYNDPEVGIAWPASAYLISDKDLALPMLREIAPLEPQD
jgi:dTDP-4-dehydrorhamnose 3,5-epimerase